MFRISMVDDNKPVREVSVSVFAERDLKRATKSLVCDRAILVLCETKITDVFKLSTLDA